MGQDGPCSPPPDSDSDEIADTDDNGGDSGFLYVGASEYEWDDLDADLIVLDFSAMITLVKAGGAGGDGGSAATPGKGGKATAQGAEDDGPAATGGWGGDGMGGAGGQGGRGGTLEMTDGADGAGTPNAIIGTVTRTRHAHDGEPGESESAEGCQ